MAQRDDKFGMNCDLSVSIILCTRNRAADLQQALQALGKLRIPSRWRAEVLIVDNGSTDTTSSVVRDAHLENMDVRYLYEAKTGKAHALNSGLTAAHGEMLLFTDDDVLVTEEWAEELVSYLMNGTSDAATGRIMLAPYLLRPWQRPVHRCFLASSDDARPHEGSRELIGANMGLRRSVLKRVPSFDPELGPGALGLGEDTLFGWQLIEAGFTIEYAPKAVVLHQPHASRLRRVHWLDEARKHGRSEAYRRYHWKHEDVSHPCLRWLALWTKLHVRRVLQPPPSFESEGGPLWELSYVKNMELCKQFRLERQHTRHYRRRGLVKVIH